MQPASNSRPRISDVARAAGVSPATVSRVTSGGAPVAPATRERVEAAIRKLGYRPDLSAASLRQRGADRTGGALVKVAVLTDYLIYAKAKTPPIQPLIDVGKSRGFLVEHVDIHQHGPLPKLLEKLYQGGFDAIIFESLSHGVDEISGTGFSNFAMLSLDRRLLHFPCHLLRYDAAEMMESAFDIARDRGYRRIGFVLHTYVSPHPDDRLLSELARGLVSTLPARDRIDPLEAGSGLARPKPPEFESWLRNNRPEVVIGFREEHLRWIRECGLRVPEDLSFIALHQTQPRVTGWVQDLEFIADQVLDLLEQMLRRGIKGPQKHHVETLIRPEWFEGNQLPR